MDQNFIPDPQNNNQQDVDGADAVKPESLTVTNSQSQDTTVEQTQAVSMPQLANSSVESDLENNTVNTPDHNETSYPSNPFVSIGKTLALILNNNLVPSLLVPFVFFGSLFLAIFVAIIAAVLGINILVYLVGIVIVLGYLLGVPAFIGTYLAIISASFNSKSITTGQAISLGMKKIFSLIGFYIIYLLAVMLGYLLFIIPGIIVSARGSLGAILIFEENLGPIAAFKRSFGLTKGHFFEALSPAMAGALFCSGGLLAPAVFVVPMAARYKDFKIAATLPTKQKVHWMNYLLPLAIVVIVALYASSIVYVVTRPKSIDSSKLNSSSSLQSDGFNFNAESKNFNSSNYNNYNSYGN